MERGRSTSVSESSSSDSFTSTEAAETVFSLTETKLKN